MTGMHINLENETQQILLGVPAKRLLEKLSLIKNRIEDSKKRWFWELLQNASDYNEKVSVKLIVNRKEIIFSHNGSPFNKKDVLSLIYPYSTKDEDTTHTDNIGKFGTGFVSTHILSSLVKLQGICQDEDSHFKFSFVLDRSMYNENAPCKEALIKAMKQARDDFEASAVNVTPTEEFNTSFTYQLGKPLSSLPAVNYNDIDLDYLYDVIPYTLCFMPKVESIIIEDNRDGNHLFCISRQMKKDDCISFLVTKDGQSTTKDFIYLSHNDVSTAFNVAESSIVPFPQKLSKLFCGLPLIGTEEVGVPILLNSLQFTPSQERESVEIQPDVNEQNRKQFKDSTELYNKVLNYIEKKQLRNAYALVQLRRTYVGAQVSRTQFDKIFVSRYKEIALSHSIVQNVKGEFTPLSQMRLPFRDSKFDKVLYDNAVIIEQTTFPRKEDYEKWFDAIDFSIFTSQKYTYEMLAERIEQANNIHGLGQNIEESKEWLANCLMYFRDVNRYIFSEKRLIPNQKGVLCLPSKLYYDADLPSELKSIYNQLSVGETIEDSLLDKQFNDIDVINQRICTADIARRIDEMLKEQYTKNAGIVASIAIPVNALYDWIEKVRKEGDNIPQWFSWYYPKRASLFVDLFTDKERQDALTIAKSGKLQELAKLASADLTADELNMLISNIDKLPKVISLLTDKIDDKGYANAKEGETGEQIVYDALRQKYPKTKGYTVCWASRERNEPCYDFEISKGGKTICYYDAKTTMRGVSNADSIPFFMRKSQWDFLQTLSEDVPYYIARVFLSSGNKIHYMRILCNFET